MTQNNAEGGSHHGQDRMSNGAIPMTMRDCVTMEAVEPPIKVVDTTRQDTKTTMGPMEDSPLTQSCREVCASATTNGNITHSP